MAEANQTDPSPTGYRELLRTNAGFRNLWFGQIVSLLGDWFNLIASASLIAALTGSGTAIGGLFALRMLAPFLASPVAGVLADRYDRRRILIVGDLCRAVIVAGFLLVRTPDDVWLLYTLTALQLAVSGTFFTARRAILPDIVSTAQLGAANALSSATWSVMLAVGAAAGGAVAGGFGIYPAFGIDAVTFLVSALFILRVRPRQAHLEAGRPSGSFFGQYAQALGYLRRTPDILAIALHKAALALVLGSGYEVARVAIANDVFGGGEGGSLSLGLMYACSGVGSGLGPVLLRRLTGDRQGALRVAIAFGYLIGAAGLVTVATLHNLPVVLLGALVTSFGSGIVWVFTTQLLLTLVPNVTRGRVFSVEHAAFTLVGAMGAAGVGGVLEVLAGIPELLRWMAAAALVPAALWAVWLAKGRQLIPSEGDEGS